MNALSWSYISFGSLFGMIVALRLNVLGLLVVATAVLGVALLGFLFAARRARKRDAETISVFIEKPRVVGEQRLPALLVLSPVRKRRRGSFKHVQTPDSA